MSTDGWTINQSEFMTRGSEGSHPDEWGKLIHVPPKLKVDRPHPCDYPHTSTDYRHTDKHLGLVMTLIAFCCTRQSRAPNIDRCAPET